MQFNQIIKDYKFQFGFTFVLIISEAGISILFPLFIGFAIDDAINAHYTGAIQLGLLGVGLAIIGFIRRVFDSRFYGKVYQNYGPNIISRMDEKDASLKNARLGMISEMIDFFEFSLPGIITNMIGLVGVIIIIPTLSMNVFYGCLIATLLTFIVFWISRHRTVSYNQSFNDTLEDQVNVIEKNDSQLLRNHVKKMMKWSIKLSDLEAINFSLSWIILLSFLVLSILIATRDGIVQYGALFALVMYVFQYVENVINLPVFYQDWLRLTEIKARLKEID